MKGRFNRPTDAARPQRPGRRAVCEALESRVLCSAAPAPHFHHTFHLFARGASSPATLRDASSLSPAGDASTPVGMTASQVRRAYGVDQIRFFGTSSTSGGSNASGNGGASTNPIVGDGTGQTIALVDAFDNPYIKSDLAAFDKAMGLPDPPSFQVVNQYGQASPLPGTDPYDPPGSPNGNWEVEEDLDVQWAHAIAPGASLILVEANDDSFNSLINNAVNWARKQSGVVAVSMSFGDTESNQGRGETSYDSYFTTPTGHPGVTFLASTGDTAAPSGYPAYSPNVVAVGGTNLRLTGGNGNSAYGSESGWSSSGGGVSSYEAKPSYQQAVTQSSKSRTNPDVSMDAGTGVAVYDAYNNVGSSPGPWESIGGTSLSSPMWAGLIAITDQGRALAHLSSLDGRSQTLPRLYSLASSPATYAADFHDVTTGNNGYAAGTGYDLVTGLGTPVANNLVPDLVNAPAPAATPQVNGGAVQRSQVTSLTLTFNTPVALQPGAVTLTQQAGPLAAAGGNVPLTVTNPSGDQMTFLVTFAGTSTTGPAVTLQNGSLPDGVYTLTVSAAGVSNAAGKPMSADSTTTFHRLFGDADGNKTVNAMDYALFKQAFGSAVGATAYSAALDFDGNGTINAADYAQFKDRFGTSVAY